MKILCIFHGQDGGLRVKGGADSAILRTGEPVFVPEPVQVWRSTVAPAIRMSRLGMSIKATKASEYYDAISLFHLLTPVDPVIVDGLPPYILDRTFSPGQWHSTSPDPLKEYRFEAMRRELNGNAEETAVSGQFSLLSLGVDDAIAALSRYMTFRTGDILVFPDKGCDMGAPMLDTEMTASLDGLPTLSIRLK